LVAFEQPLFTFFRQALSFNNNRVDYFSYPPLAWPTIETPVTKTAPTESLTIFAVKKKAVI
jgi:hypothetical protein